MRHAGGAAGAHAPCPPLALARYVPLPRPSADPLFPYPGLAAAVRFLHRPNAMSHQAFAALLPRCVNPESLARNAVCSSARAARRDAGRHCRRDAATRPTRSDVAKPQGPPCCVAASRGGVAAWRRPRHVVDHGRDCVRRDDNDSCAAPCRCGLAPLRKKRKGRRHFNPHGQIQNHALRGGRRAR